MDTDSTQIKTEDHLSKADQDQKDVELASRSLKAMSHPLRLMILCKLGEQEFSVQDIVDNVGTSQSNISQHLAILRDNIKNCVFIVLSIIFKNIFNFLLSN